MARMARIRFLPCRQINDVGASSAYSLRAVSQPLRSGDRPKYMPFLRANQPPISKSSCWVSNFVETALAFFLFLGSAAYLPAQTPTSPAHSPAKVEPTTTIDPLGRETPRAAVIGFLKYEERGDFATAARYLQPPSGQDTNLTQLAEELQALHARFKGNVALLSDDPNGAVEAGLPPGHVRAGVLTVDGMTADVVLVRVDDKDSGKIWLISKDTVARIPQLYAELGTETPTAAYRLIPAALTTQRLTGMSLAQWLGWLLSIPLSWSLAWLLEFLLRVPGRAWSKLRKRNVRPVWDGWLGMPFRCIIAISIHSFLVYLLNPPLLYRVYYFRLMAALLVGSVAWLVSKLTDRGFEGAVNRARTQRKGGESILVLMQRLTRVTVLVIAFLSALAIFGLNITTELAGLGIGGLAIALAAQKSLENLIGGVSLLMDKAVQVGDFCRIGDHFGTVEDIGLRSLKVRTLGQNLLVVPNGMLAQMQFENMKSRSKLLISQNFSLRIETQVEQLRFVLDRVQSMLDEHPTIEPGTSRVRVANFAGAAFELELFAYGKTGDWAQFTAIRQDVILKIAEIVEAAGTRFAAPTQLTYLSADAGVDPEKANGVVRRVTELRASDTFRFPGEARTGTK
jgi:MscS family membrane protein